MALEQIKILYITVRADFGGGPEHLFQIIQHKPDQWDTFVACPDDVPYASRYQSIVGSDHLCFIPHRKFSFRALRKLISFVRENSIQLIHSHGKGAGLYSRLIHIFTGIPCVHTFHGIHTGGYSYALRKLYTYYERCMGIFTRHAIAVSEGEKNILLQKKIIPKERLSCIPNGIVIPQVTLGLSDRPIHYIVSITRFDFQKRTDFIIPIIQGIIKKRQDIHCILVGDGLGKTRLERIIKNKGLEQYITCVGAQKIVAPYLQKASVYLSTSRWEGLPLAILEAMSYGLPIVATDVVGNKDAVIDTITGILYPLDSVEKAVQALIDIIENPKLANKLGYAGRERACMYSVEQMMESLIQLYPQCIKEIDQKELFNLYASEKK